MTQKIWRRGLVQMAKSAVRNKLAGAIGLSELKHEATKSTETHEGLVEMRLDEWANYTGVVCGASRGTEAGSFVRLRGLRAFVLQPARMRSRVAIRSGHDFWRSAS